MRYLLGFALLSISLCHLFAVDMPQRTPAQITYTLYRNSKSFPDMRIHVATFDANETAEYNKENAELAAKLFQSQEGVTVKFWVESGYFSKTPRAATSSLTRPSTTPASQARTQQPSAAGPVM